MERLICLAIGYVFGLFQTSYLIGRKNKMDIREHGSGNAGVTNAFRVMGKKAGALTLVGDILKCVFAMLLCAAIFKTSHADVIPMLKLYAAAGVILGHNFPCYLKFKGGKGIAASVGMLIAFDWKVLLICAVVFFTIFAITHYVSLCSLSAYVVGLVSIIVLGQRGAYQMAAARNLELYIVMACLTILAFIRHRSNIKRLLAGNENKIFLKKKG